MGPHTADVTDSVDAMLRVLLPWPARLRSQQIGWRQLHAGSHI